MRRYYVFALMGITSLLASMSGTVISVAFNDIMVSFGASVVGAGWVLTISQISNCLTMPIGGKACDIFGQKKMFIVCMSFFTVGSIFSLLAPNLPLLVVARFIQGVGVGGNLPVATSIIADQFPEARQKYIGFLTSIFPAGMIIGPNLGGWLTSAYGWRANFWIFIPPGIIAFVLAFFLLKKNTVKQKAKLDLVGAAILTAAIACVMVAISLTGAKDSPIPWPTVGILLVAAVFMGGVFFIHQRRSDNPVIDFALLKERPFVATNIFNFIYGASLLGVMSFIPFYAVTVYGMSTLESGVILTPRSVFIMITGVVSSLYMVRWGYRKPILWGTLLFVACLFLLIPEFKDLSAGSWQVNNALLLSTILVLAGLSQGFINPAANNACIELMPERIATITGLRGLFRQIGGTLSLGICALILNNIGDIRLGFQIVLGGTAFLMLLAIPFIFMIPNRAREPGSSGTAIKTYGYRPQ